MLYVYDSEGINNYVIRYVVIQVMFQAKIVWLSRKVGQIINCWLSKGDEVI